MVKLDNIVIDTEFGAIDFPSQKIYEFILKLNKERAKNADLRLADIESFFKDEDYSHEYKNLHSHKVQSYIYSFWEVVERDFNIEKIINYDAKNQAEKPPKGFDFKISPDEKRHLLLDCIIFMKSKENEEKMVLDITPYHDSDSVMIDIEAYCDSNGAGFRGLWKSIEEHFAKEGSLKNRLFNTAWDYVDFDERNWDSIVISDEDRKTIDRNIISFIANIEEYRDLRLPTSRGLLITGPPGTGKTLLCETIINQVNCTKVYVTSDSVSKIGDIKEIYRVARVLSPSIVIIEDIDTLGGLDRRQDGNHPLLGEFLNCLNGVGSNDGVVTLATTNYPKHLDSALVDRPGRIDLRIDFDLPSKEIREHIFKKYLSELKTSKIDYSDLSKKSEGMTGAYIREVVMSSYMISQETDGIITQKTILEALKSVKEMRGALYGNKDNNKTYYN